LGAEIERSIDFLAVSARNAPQRHRSTRAVFDSSFALLSKVEQSLFCRLAVFRNGFTPSAAKEITGVDLFALLGMVDKSLLQRIDDRYIMHEILRQDAYEKLNASGEEFEKALNHHADYYANLFERLGGTVTQHPDDPSYTHMMNDVSNFMQAWEQIRRRADIPLMGRLLRPFFRLFDMQNRYAEAEQFFQQAVDNIQQASSAADTFVLA
jgi:predicted ATPase